MERDKHKTISIPDKITQGTILSGAVCSTIKAKEAWGVIITARCDIEQDKTSIYSYLPIVRVEDWVLDVGYEKAITAQRSSIHGTAVKLMTENTVAESVLTCFGVDVALGKLPESKKKKSLRNQIITCKQLEERVDIFNNECCAEVRQLLYTKTKEMMNNQSKEYYYIEEVDATATGSCAGYVALIREIRILSRKIIKVIEKTGITIDDLVNLRDDTSTHNLLVSDDVIAMPIGQMASPNIEHLMQSFSYIYGRIGLPDKHNDVFKRVESRILGV